MNNMKKEEVTAGVKETGLCSHFKSIPFKSESVTVSEGIVMLMSLSNTSATRHTLSFYYHIMYSLCPSPAEE